MVRADQDPLDGSSDDRSDVGVDDDDARSTLGPARLDILKALGDNTRYAIYLELVRSPIPLTTADIAEVLVLHVNTVRPHLERMRDVGLLQVDTGPRGAVGRPQHRYSVAADAPTLGLEPSPLPTLARVLLEAAATGGLDSTDVTEAARNQGRLDGARYDAGVGCVEALVESQAQFGFDPEAVASGDGATVAFAHCPFHELAEDHPELVCALHCGLVTGFVESFPGAAVRRFSTLVDRTPCQVELVAP